MLLHLDLVAKGILGPDDFVKTIIFTNSIQKTLEIQRFLRQHLPITCYPYIDTFHALCSARAKKHSLGHFHKGKTKILVAMEATGMVSDFQVRIINIDEHDLQGADIPDIEVVIQFGIPASLEVWTQ